MSILHKSVIAFSLAATMSAAGQSAQSATVAKPTAVSASSAAQKAEEERIANMQLQLVLDYKRAQKQENFIVLDKYHAKLIVYNGGEPIFETAALFGEADDRIINRQPIPGSTPVGEFVLNKKSINKSDGPEGSSISYFCPGDDVCLTIHPTVGPDRAARYGIPARSNASSGCINTTVTGYGAIKAFVSAYVSNDEKIPVVILPRKPDLERTRVIFRIPENFGKTVQHKQMDYIIN